MRQSHISGAAALALLGALGASAQPSDSLARRIEELDQKIRVVERLNEIAKEDAKEAAAKQGRINAGPGTLGFASADGAFSLRYSGFIQTVARRFLTDPATPRNNAHDLSVRRLQTDVRGTAYKNFGWRFHANFAGNAVEVLDAQFDWNLLPELNLTAGKFKTPTGLERLLSSPRAPFVEGSFVTVLQPNRDFGVQLHGDFGKGRLQYQAGLFTGAGDNVSSNGDLDEHKDAYLRLFSHPFAGGAEALAGLGAGVSASYGKRENGLPGSIATPGRQSFNPYATSDTLDGALYRVSPQAYYYYGPLGVIAEYTRTTVALRNGTSAADLTNSAWAVTASLILTGEKNDYRGGPKVAKPNNWPQGSDFGALELLARVHGIHIDEAIAGTYGPTNQNNGIESALSGGLALGWYLNNVFKIFAGYDRTTFANVAAAPAGRVPEHVLNLSFNVAF